MLTVLCKGTLLRMRLTVGVRSVLRCDSLAMDYVKFYVSALVGVIIKVILQNARCNNKESDIQFRYLTHNFLIIFTCCLGMRIKNNDMTPTASYYYLVANRLFMFRGPCIV